MRRDHVASTLIQRHFDIVCLLGMYLHWPMNAQYVIFHSGSLRPSILLIWWKCVKMKKKGCGVGGVKSTHVWLVKTNKLPTCLFPCEDQKWNDHVWIIRIVVVILEQKEPQRAKTYLLIYMQTKTQVSLRICIVWSIFVPPVRKLCFLGYTKYAQWRFWMRECTGWSVSSLGAHVRWYVTGHFGSYNQCLRNSRRLG